MPAPDRPPSFPLYVRDFLGDKHVRAMEQMPWPHGFVAAWGYTRIWMGSWEEPEPGVLPDDDRVLSAMAGISPARWPRYREVISRCFDTTSRPGFWVQKRVVRERQFMVARRRIAEESGRKGGRKRVQNEKKQAVPKPPLTNPQPGGATPGGATPLPLPLPLPEETKNLSVPRTELSTGRPGDVPAGTAGSRTQGDPNPELVPERGNGMTPIGEVLRHVTPHAMPDVTPRGTLTGADLSTAEGQALERDEQLRRLHDAERGESA